MYRTILNFIFLFLFLILISVPIFTYSLLDIELQNENDLNNQKLTQEQETKKTLEKNYLLGKFDPSVRNDFTIIPKENSISGYTMYLRRETLNSFLAMEKAANEDGVTLKIASATRNFDYQKNLWNNKWTGVTLVNKQNLSTSIPDELFRFKKILEYSAAPGTSRHHWGTEIDINNASPDYFDNEPGEKEYNWLVINAPFFGFCQPYNLKNDMRAEGYNQEKWHWTYLPLSKTFTKEYKKLITSNDIKGFDGDQYVPGENLLDNYVLSINPECL